MPFYVWVLADIRKPFFETQQVSEENDGHISVCLIFVSTHETAVFLLAGVETPFLQIHI